MSPDQNQQEQQNQEEQKVTFDIKTGEVSRLVHYTPILHVRIPIDPKLAESKDDKFKLTSGDGKYEKVLTVKDDKVDGDDFIDLVYDGLKVSQKYTLEVDPGAEGSPYKLFEDVPYQELVDYYSILEEGDELEESEEEEEDSGDDPDWEDEEDGSSEYGGDPSGDLITYENDEEEYQKYDPDEPDEWDKAGVLDVFRKR